MFNLSPRCVEKFNPYLSRFSTLSFIKFHALGISPLCYLERVEIAKSKVEVIY
jgi:hypothetical protein